MNVETRMELTRADLSDFLYFLAIARHRSFRAAALELPTALRLLIDLSGRSTRFSQTDEQPGAARSRRRRGFYGSPSGARRRVRPCSALLMVGRAGSLQSSLCAALARGCGLGLSFRAL